MRVLIQMGDSYPDESPCAKRIRTFYEVFKELGDEVIVLAPRDKNSIDNVSGAIYCPTIPLKKKTSLYRFLNSYVFGITSFLMSKRIKNIDVVITTSPPPLISIWGKRIARGHGAKLVYDVRDIWPDVAWEMGAFGENSIYSRVFEWIRNDLLKNADIITTVSPGKVKKLKEYNPSKEILEIQNGLDEAFLTNSEDKGIIDKYQINEIFTVCYIGNLGMAQGLIQLLKLAEKAKDSGMKVQFLIFGSGADELSLKSYATVNGLVNVSFPGRIQNKYIYTVLKNSKISFVSLVNENLKDSIPTKIYEAIGVGCPVLLAACGDAAELIEKCGFGVAVMPNDEKALWEAFQYMYENYQEYEGRKVAAIDYILANYSRQKAAQKMNKYLKLLINSI